MIDPKEARAALRALQKLVDEVDDDAEGLEDEGLEALGETGLDKGSGSKHVCSKCGGGM